jgi:amino acid adenylation domain-containing protein
MTIGEYIKSLKKRNIYIGLDNDQLKIKADKEALSEQVISEIKAKKAEIIDFLINEQTVDEAGHIVRTSEKPYYSLSSAQNRLHFLYAFNASSLSYNISVLLKLEGVLDREKLYHVFRALIARHESLRTSFVMVDDLVVQKVQGSVPLTIEVFETGGDEIDAVINTFIRPFNLSEGPLMRVGLLGISTLEHILIVDMHHIIADGVSKGILIKDFMSLYNGESLPALSVQFKDFSEWQQSPKEQQRIGKQKAFWLEQLSGELHLLDLPADYPRPVIKRDEGAHFHFSVSARQVSRLQEIANAQGASLFMVMLTMYNILLAKICNQEDIIVGIPAAGRRHAELDGVIGMFVNTVPIRNFPVGIFSFKEFLASVKQQALGALECQDYQYDDLVETLQLTRDASRNALFDVMMAYQNYEEPSLELPGLRINSYTGEKIVSKFDLTLDIRERNNEWILRFEYSTALFKAATIARFAGYLQQIINEVSRNIHVKIAEINILSDAERRILLDDFNNTQVANHKEADIIALFEEQVSRMPDRVAVSFNAVSINYASLNSMADAIADRLLRMQTFNANDRIAFLIEPSVEMVATMLAIAKIGCAYVPLSPNDPIERQQFIYVNSNARVLVAQETLLMENATWDTIDPENELLLLNDKVFATADAPACKMINRAGDVMCLLYASGAAVPAGLPVLRSGVVNMIHFYRQLFGLSAGIKVSQVADIDVDAATFEIWLCLMTGGTLHIAPVATRKDGPAMENWLQREQIEITFQLPAIAEWLLKQEGIATGNTLQVVAVTGEALNYKPVSILPFRLIKLYSHIEGAFWTTYKELKADNIASKFNIGKPIAPKQALILDKYQNLQPIGVQGELCIAGNGWERGYLTNDTLATKKSLHDFFTTHEEIYKTGDLARWTAEGEIELLGKPADQIRIRGFRIEAAAVEACLNEFNGVDQSVVKIFTKESGKYLVAYYTSVQDVDDQALKEYMEASLPHYMVPSFFIQLDSIPYQFNGKIDHKALPSPNINNRPRYVAPSGKIEEQLVELWAEVLKVSKDKISVTGNFFDIGGNSISIIKLNSKINNHFQSNIPVAEMFMFPTIMGIKDFIINKDKGMKSIADNIDNDILQANEMFNLMTDHE